MGNLLGKKSSTARPKEREVSEMDRTILQLKTQRDKMKQMVRRYEKTMEREKEMARELVKKGQKDRALLLLKKKKVAESTIERTVKQLEQVERMVSELEFADVQARVVEGLRSGNEALKNMNKLFNVDEIEQIMEETKEAAAYQQEITELISGSLTAEDAEAAEQELAEILKAQEKAVVAELPDVPTHELPVAEATEEAEGVPTKTAKRERVAVASS